MPSSSGIICLEVGYDLCTADIRTAIIEFARNRLARHIRQLVAKTSSIILLLGWPLTAFWVTGLLLGINLIFSGATNAAVAIAARRSLSPASP